MSFFPIWILMSDLEIASACASVLTEMNSTPSSCSSIMRLTALPPPPPTPTTFIRAFWTPLSSSSKIMVCSLGPTQKKSWSHRFTGASTFSTAGDFRAPGPEPAAHRHLPGAVEHQPGRYRHSR